MKRSLDRIFRLGFRALLWVCVLVPVADPSWSRAARAADPLGLEAAVGEVRAALGDMAGALDGAPLKVQTTIGADLHLMSQAIARSLDRLEGDGTPVADPTLAYDLDFLADVTHAATDELRAIAAEPGLALDPGQGERIDRLTETAAERVAEINLVIDGWNERARNAVVEVRPDDGGVLVVRSIDKLIYNGIRYVSVALLLVGLLAVGLQVLRAGERGDAPARAGRSALRSGLAAGALAVFFLGCIVFSLRPGTLAALSADVRLQAPDHPCERLAAQRDRLLAAQQTDYQGLVEATKRRMLPAAKDCLGLPSQAVTAEAIERMAAKTALARREPELGDRSTIGLAAAEPPRNGLRATTPPDVAPLEPTETQGSDGLVELLASIRDSSEPPAADLASPGASLPAPIRPVEPAAPPAGAALDPGAPAAPPAKSAPAPVEPVAPPAGSAAGPGAPATAVEPAAGPEPTIAPDAPAPASRARPPEVKPVLFVTTTALNYREGPSVDARRLGTLDAGARLTVLAQDDGGWAAVRLSDGRQAYVAREFLEPAPRARRPEPDAPSPTPGPTPGPR